MPGATERDRGYWRDVGTIDAYFEANMDLISIHPVFNLYNDEWPIYTSTGYLPPAKFVHGIGDRVGEALNSAVSPGVVVSGAQVHGSVLAPRVKVHSYATIVDSVILDSVDIARYATIRRAIIDKYSVVEEPAKIRIDTTMTAPAGSTSARTASLSCPATPSSRRRPDVADHADLRPGSAQDPPVKRPGEATASSSSLARASAPSTGSA